MKPIVQFNANIYKYPFSISRGYWGTYLLDEGLSSEQLRSRGRWLQHVRDKSRTPFHEFVCGTFSEPNDRILLQTLILAHGVFVERFFHAAIRRRILAHFGELSYNLREFQQLLSSAIGYEFRVRSAIDAVWQVISHLYEQAAIEAIEEPHTNGILKEWFFENRDGHSCSLCGVNFRLIDLPDWAYFGANGFKGCCLNCKLLASPRKAALPKLIRRFVSLCGFVPNAAATPINNRFTSQLTQDKWHDVILSYAAMGGSQHVKKKFGSWFEGLARSGALPDDVQIMARGVRCLAADGHVCFSLEERQIDDWFSGHGIPHEREPFYPQHEQFNPTGRRRADWKVLDVYVEYFGLSGDESYDNKLEEKLLLAKALSIDLIALYPQDITKLDQILGRFVES